LPNAEAATPHRSKIGTPARPWARFEAGDIGYGQAKQALSRAISTRQQLGYASGNAGQRKELADLIKRERGFQSEILIREAKALSSGIEGFNFTTPQQNLNRWISLLKSGRLDPAGMEEATDAALEAMQAIFDQQMASADTAAEQAKLFAEGIPTPEALQTQLVYQYLQTSSVAFQDFIFSATGGLLEYSDAVTRTTAEIYAKGNIAFTDAARQAIQLQISAIQALKQKAIEGLARAAAMFPISVNLDDVAKIYDDQIKGLYGSLGNIPDVQIPDFGRFGQDAARSAEAAKQAADEAAAEREALFKAQNDLNLAIRGDDPVGTAYTALVNANHAAEIAKTASERVQAQADAVRANRSLQEAFQDIALSQISLAQAMADAAGDTVESSKLALDAAKQRLANVKQNTPFDTSAINAASGEIIAAERTAYDAVLTKKEDDIQFALQMEQITKQQAIDAYTLLLQIPTNTEKQNRELQLIIKGLTDEAGQNYQFNLPSNLDLPTLYEARRLDQAGGGGYQDNRVVTINFTANNTADAQAIANQIVDQFSRPTRFGTAGRPY
jgi:hypothetical protein